MSPLRSLTLSLVASLVLLLGGCDDGISPSDLGGLDPLALVDALNRMASPLQPSGHATANLQAAVPSLAAAGVSLMPTDFPPGATGHTFVYEPETGGWAADSVLTGAPPAGVRVLWYSLDGSGEIAHPPEVRGHIDLEPVEGGASDSLALTVTRSDGGVTLLHLVQGLASTGEPPATNTFRAEGFYSDGSRTVDLVVGSDVSQDTGTGDEDYLLRVALDDPDLEYTLEVEGTVGGASGDTTDVVTATAVRAGATTVMEVSFRVDGDSGGENVSGTLTHRGTLIANIALVGNSYRFSKPNGDPFPSGQATELNSLFGAMSRTGFLVLLNLPLFLP